MQRRRTRRAIVEAATRLLAAGATPSISDIAAEADVSRRTVYMYFPSLVQLLIDATMGSLVMPKVDAAIEQHESAASRIEALALELMNASKTALPLGRRLIRLTVETPPAAGAPVRGYRRVEWIERALSPLRKKVTHEQFERLVSALSVFLGWEGMVVLRDVRGLERRAEERVTLWVARTLVAAMLAEARR